MSHIHSIKLAITYKYYTQIVDSQKAEPTKQATLNDDKTYNITQLL